jgi:hypothetical protein
MMTCSQAAQANITEEKEMKAPTISDLWWDINEVLDSQPIPTAPILWPEMANAIIHPKTGKAMEYHKLI